MSVPMVLVQVFGTDLGGRISIGVAIGVSFLSLKAGERMIAQIEHAAAVGRAEDVASLRGCQRRERDGELLDRIRRED